MAGKKIFKNLYDNCKRGDVIAYSYGGHNCIGNPIVRTDLMRVISKMGGTIYTKVISTDNPHLTIGANDEWGGLTYLNVEDTKIYSNKEYAFSSATDAESLNRLKTFVYSRVFKRKNNNFRSYIK